MEKKEIQALFHMQRIICDFGEDSACPALVSRVFPATPSSFWRNPRSTVFCRNRMYLFANVWILRLITLENLGLNLGLHRCNLSMYPHCLSIYLYTHIHVTCVHITCALLVSCKYLIQDKKGNTRTISLNTKLKILIILLD